jgi:probable rRNA maturation factor
MINIQVDEHVEGLWEGLGISFETLEEAAHETLYQTSSAGDSELTIVLSPDELLHEMNQEFLEIDAPTDVLSFPADFTDPDTQANYLGDILISIPTAIAQSQAGGHPLKDELQLLVVHGVLHLAGYDHAEAEDRLTMQEIQDVILKQLGCSVRPTL